MISVIIPTYKGSKCLSRAIDSALNQVGVEIEVIVVDDNSPDSNERKETEMLMRGYANNERVIYLQHTKNMNGSVARNTGIAKSHGEIISFLDDDDFYFPDRLMKCLKRMEETNCDIVYTDVLITKENIPCGYTVAQKEGNLFFDLFVDENIFGTGSNLFLKKDIILKNGGFCENLPRQQDYEFLLRQFSLGAKVSAVKECLVVKSMNGTNNSPKYEVLRDIKYGLLDEFDKEIKSLSLQNQMQVIISQHKELLHAAMITKNDKGIVEQKSELKKKGYKFCIVDYWKEMMLRSSFSVFFQIIIWRGRSKKIIRKHEDACNFASENIIEWRASE